MSSPNQGGDFTLELLESFLQGQSFFSARRSWVDAHCRVFAGWQPGVFSHNHRKYFDRFNEDLNEILQERLSNLGLTEDDIEAKCSDRSQLELRAMLQEVPTFEEFAEEMFEAFQRQQLTQRPSLCVLWDLENVPLPNQCEPFAHVSALKSALSQRLGAWVLDPRTPLEIQVFHYPADTSRSVQKALARIAGLQLVDLLCNT